MCWSEVVWLEGLKKSSEMDGDWRWLHGWVGKRDTVVCSLRCLSGWCTPLKCFDEVGFFSFLSCGLSFGWGMRWRRRVQVRFGLRCGCLDRLVDEGISKTVKLQR